MKNNILVLALATLLMVCCTKNDDIIVPEEGLMQITALHPASTRATADAFESGDKIGVYVTDYTGENASPLQISGNWANNVATTYNGSEWNPAKKIFWSENKMDVYGYYPYMTPTSIDEHQWSVRLDQSTPETADALSGYEASDFLWGKATGVSQTDGDVQLEFKHTCSKMVIKLVKGEQFTDEFSDDTKVYLHSTVPTSTIDFDKGIVSKDIYGTPQKIRAKQVSTDTYEVILIPQSITERMPSVEVEMSGVSYMFSYRPGVQYIVAITLNSSPEQIEVKLVVVLKIGNRNQN